MSLIPFMPIIDKALEKVLDLIPDPNAKRRAEEAFRKEVANAAAEQGRQQSEINKEEAKHASVFVAGWRPFIGWVCGIALAYHFVAQPLLVFIMAVSGNTFPLPEFDMNALMTILLGMLGLGMQRSWEKINGVTTGLAPKAPK